MASYNSIVKIIANIKRLFPSSQGNDVILDNINRAIRKNYRWIMQSKFDTIATVTDQAEYAIQSDCRIDGILSVKVGDDYYKPGNAEGPYNLLSGLTYYEQDGALGIFPLPDEDGIDILVKYRQVPAEYTDELSTDIVPYIEDAADVVNYWVCQRLAFIDQDDAAANNFIILYTDALKEAKLKISNTIGKPKIKDVMTRGRGRTL